MVISDKINNLKLKVLLIKVHFKNAGRFDPQCLNQLNQMPALYIFYYIRGDK